MRGKQFSILHPPQTNHNAHTEMPCPDSPDPPLPKPVTSPSTNISISPLLFPRNIPPDLLTQHQPLQYSTCLLPVLAAAFHSLLVTHPYASSHTQGLQSLPATLILNHRASHNGHDVGLSLYGLLLVPQKANFGF